MQLLRGLESSVCGLLRPDDENQVERSDNPLQRSFMTVISGQLALMVEVILVRLIDRRLARRSETDVGISSALETGLVNLVASLRLVARKLSLLGTDVPHEA